MASVNQIVTENILKMIASGEILSWEQAFIRTKRNVNSKKNYSMLNQLMLSGDRSELFITPKKAGEIGLDFTGVKTRIVTFWGTVDKVIDGEKKKIWFLRYYRVFGLDQCPESEVKTKLMEKSGVYKNHTPLNEIDALVKKIGANIEVGESGRCFYSPADHAVSMPKLSTFTGVEEYYSALFHELVHWTGHKTELDRHNKKYEYEKENTYSYEELVAELGSAMLMSHFGISSPDSFRNSAAYLKGWAKKLSEDCNMIISASSKADKAVAYLLEKMGIATTTEAEAEAE